MESEDSALQVLDDIVKEITEKSAGLILEWTKERAGDIAQWFSLMESIVKITQDNYAGQLTGIEKADVSTRAVLGLAQQLWDKWTDGLSDEEKHQMRQGELKTVAIIMDNPAILKASTSFLKKLLNFIDKDGDGEISADECKMFWCCGSTNVCKKKSKK